MKLFIGNFTGKEHLSRLAKLLRRYGYHSDTKYMVTKLKSGEQRFYAVVEMSSERLANKLSKKLANAKELETKLIIREYKQRSYSNERRALGWRDREWSGIERRIEERRRNGESKRRKKRREPERGYQVREFNGISFDS